MRKPPAQPLARKRWWKHFHRKMYLQGKHHRDWHLRWQWIALGKFETDDSYEAFLTATGRQAND